MTFGAIGIVIAALTILTVIRNVSLLMWGRIKRTLKVNIYPINSMYLGNGDLNLQKKNLVL